jgi:hypothetical protein
MRYFLWLLLYVYGLLYHITSSEFWPVTISKTWFTPEAFEYSMLQKPLLSLFLALFHLLPLNDVIHIFLVKTVFAVLGITALTYFCHFILELSGYQHRKIQKSDLAALMAFVLVCASPLIRTNFFSIRSDQVAFLFFSLFLVFCIRRQFWPALVTLVLIPCAGIKEIIFLLPGGIYFFWSFRNTISPKVLLFATLSSLCVLIWAIALNMNSVFYLLQTYYGTDYSLRFGKLALLSDIHLLFLSFAGIIFVFLKGLKKYYGLCWLALSSAFFIACLPQATPFFLASVLPLSLLPASALIFELKSVFLKIASALVLIGWSLGFAVHFKLPLHISNIQQLWFIEIASKIVASNDLSYLDGQGVLPRQKFIPCFVSPNDEVANNGCREWLTENKSDVLIITNRLASLGAIAFRATESGYTQVYPNFWVKNEKMNPLIKAKIELSGSKPLPIIIF